MSWPLALVLVFAICAVAGLSAWVLWLIHLSGRETEEETM